MENKTNTNATKKPGLFQYILAIIILPFYLLFSKKTRKAAWAMLLVVAAIWGGIVLFGGSESTALKKGDKAMSAGRYSAAVKNYMKAGEVAQEEWMEAVKAYIGQLDSNIGSEEELVKILLSADKSRRAEESYGTAVLEIASMLMERAENAAYTGFDSERKEAVKERYTTIGKLMDGIGNQELAGLEKAEKELILSWTVTLLEQTTASYAKWMWEEKTDNAYCAQLLEAYNMLENDDKAAAEIFRNLLGGTRYIDRLDSLCYLRINPSVPGSVNSELAKAKDSAKVKDFNMTEYYENGTWPEKVKLFELGTGIAKDALSKQLSNRERAELAQRIGKEADGKVLALHKRTGYGATKPVLEIDLGFMRKLPSQLLPERLEEVEFVILVVSGYEEDGKYDNSKIAHISEHAEIILYDAVGGKELIHTETVSGGYAFSVMYSGEAPEWHSGGVPMMEDEKLQILQEIERQLKKQSHSNDG